MDILTVMAVGALNLACFLAGAWTAHRTAEERGSGQGLAGRRRGGETPKKGLGKAFHPLRAYRIRRAAEEAERERERMEVILRNIDRYDGTAAGQEDVP